MKRASRGRTEQPGRGRRWWRIWPRSSARPGRCSAAACSAGGGALVHFDEHVRWRQPRLGQARFRRDGRITSWGRAASTARQPTGQAQAAMVPATVAAAPTMYRSSVNSCRGVRVIGGGRRRCAHAQVDVAAAAQRQQQAGVQRHAHRQPGGRYRHQRPNGLARTGTRPLATGPARPQVGWRNHFCALAATPRSRHRGDGRAAPAALEQQEAQPGLQPLDALVTAGCETSSSAPPAAPGHAGPRPGSDPTVVQAPGHAYCSAGSCE